jgi:hypothetical protein
MGRLNRIGFQSKNQRAFSLPTSPTKNQKTFIDFSISPTKKKISSKDCEEHNNRVVT